MGTPFLDFINSPWAYVFGLSLPVGLAMAACLIVSIFSDDTLFYLKKFAKSLRNHRVGICNYAKYKLSSARIEAGNISIGMIRKRARGIRDTEYFQTHYPAVFPAG